MKRRQFIGAVVGGLGALAAGEAPAGATEADVPLGKRGVRAARLGLGTHACMRPADPALAGRDAFVYLVRHAYDRDIRLFDTTDLYGTHAYLREAIRGLPRDRITLQARLWFRPDGLARQAGAEEAVERLLRELDTGYLDCVLLHGADGASWPAEQRPLMDALTAAKARGLIRAHGIACRGLPALRAAAASPWPDVVMAPLNHGGLCMDGAPDEVAALLRGMRAAGKGVVAAKVFAEGRLRTAAERAGSLRFALSRADMALIGFSSREQIDEALRR